MKFKKVSLQYQVKKNLLMYSSATKKQMQTDAERRIAFLQQNSITSLPVKDIRFSFPVSLLKIN